MKHRALLGLLLLVMTACAAPAAPAAPEAGPILATATLIDARRAEVGRAEFRESSGGVAVRLTVTGLPPGVHGVHIHAVGVCEPPDFTSARAHFNPENKKHGAKSPEGQHAGDLPNITVAGDGSGVLETTSTHISLDGSSDHSIVRSGGTALVIHAGPDDEITDPIGNSGTRFACGPIVGSGASAP